MGPPYMSMVEIVSDVTNPLLSRRELTCNFTGLGGRLGRLESVNLVTQKCNLEGKMVIPLSLKNHVGKPTITGLFYVYDDKNLAKRHVNPTILSRLEKSQKKAAEAAAADGGEGNEQSGESS